MLKTEKPRKKKIKRKKPTNHNKKNKRKTKETLSPRAFLACAR
jgi:hypothetical protein